MVLMGIEACFFGLDLALSPPLTKAQQASVVVLDKDGYWLRALPVKGGIWRLRADLDRTDPSFLKHLILVEDARFQSHLGVDPMAVVRAAISNREAGRTVSGGSTLSMQTARLLEPHPRSLGAKLIEAIRALQLEWRYTKSELLSLYLSLTPYGGNLEGVRAASLSYFGHEPQSLTLGEQALLIALPQAPESRRPDRFPKAAHAARDLVLHKLRAKGAISQSQLKEALAEPVLAQRRPFETLAFHATGRLARLEGGTRASLYTTIDARLQTRLEALAKQTAADQGPLSSVCIMVIDIKTRAVRAVVGSGGLDRPGGWVDMSRAIRSPGSTLKPFIYGLGFDEGIVAPDTRLMDSATRFGDYQPEDFDKVFHGEVSVKEALVNSLNVPAVAVLNRIGADSFESRLEGSGIALKRPKTKLASAGLALALGGAGIRLEDLAKLYAGLGDHGLIKPLAYTKAQEKQVTLMLGSRLLSRGAADKIMAILKETPPPSGRLPSALMRAGNRPAFKTGTSYGFRDALALGIGGGYCVLVWTGRPDGGARSDMTGREASAPLLFDVFDQLNAPSQTPNRVTVARAPEALKTLSTGKPTGPSILFPPKGATLFVEARSMHDNGRFEPVRGLKLSARGTGAYDAPLKWYVDSKPLIAGANGVVWMPEAEGFYTLKVIDAGGQQSEVKVRIRAVIDTPNP